MKQTTTYARCYESHPPLKIGEYSIYGGSCSSPIVTNADVYVGFDHSMAPSPMSFPWVEGESFLYPITDMQAPKDPESFKALIEWLAVQLIADKLVHIGCIGGHGRTGTVLAALVKHMTGNEDAITYVRENYCEKAVESQVQIDFLNKHFGIKPVALAKAFASADPYSYPATSGSTGGKWTSSYKPSKGSGYAATSDPAPKAPVGVYMPDYKASFALVGPEPA